MPKPKHTPGPWAADTSNPVPTMKSLRKVVAKVQVYLAQNRPGRKEREANAHLIAAAPELLEALKEAIGWNWLDDDVPENVVEKINATIAKAEGRT